MTQRKAIGDIQAGRLSAEACAAAFGDLHPPLNRHEALIESSRCLFCFDAPCIHACPTSIDIPSFIRKINTGNTTGAARDILSQNIMGAMCARVCPTETLCEEACVRNLHEHKPVRIGRLQRYAVDALLEADTQLFQRGPDSGKRVAVVGAGPAGLSCAHRLATLGHAVTVFDARGKPGGLNEYGIAAYKVPGGIAQREVDYILGVGGIEVRTGMALGRDIALAGLRHDFDAVFLGLGLAGVNALGLDGGELAGVQDAVAFIAALRQAEDPSTLPMGRRVVVIGGGMTAIDVAVQSRKLGAEDVTIAYRRGPEQMGASSYEQELAQTSGVGIKHWAAPVGLTGEAGVLTGIVFEGTRLDETGRLVTTGDRFTLAADMVFKAIGQTFEAAPLGNDIDLENGRIRVDAERRTSVPGVWAGGDCVLGGEDLTVVAVEDGKVAALSIDRALRA